MANFLGFALFSDINAFYNWQGEDNSPAPGTVNYLLGFNSSGTTQRYTAPISNVYNAQIIGVIDDICPQSVLPSPLYTLAQVQIMGFLQNNSP